MMENRVTFIFILILLSLISTGAWAAKILKVEVIAAEPLISDVPQLNIGDILHLKVITDGKGEVTVDISTVHQGIILYDDGTHGDIVAGDFSYEADYRIIDGDTVEKGPVLAHFIAEDASRADTKQNDDITPFLTIDATRPVITDDSALPSPFNPNYQVALVRYILTEKAEVKINITNSDRQLIRILGMPSGNAGENIAVWDGMDADGKICEDGRYSYLINATDQSGNTASPVGGGIILTTVRMEIGNSFIAPNPFSPDGDKVNDSTRIQFDVKLYASEEQLRILGFGMGNSFTATKLDDDKIAPFALVGLTIFNSSGDSTYNMPTDLSPNSDADPAPNGWPNKVFPPEAPPGSGNILGSPSSLRDFGDGDASNDWDSLIPLNGPFPTGNADGLPAATFAAQAGESFYTASFGLEWDALDSPDGTYLIDIRVELVERAWQFAGFLREQDVITGEMWHAFPVRRFGVVSESRTKTVTVARQLPLLPDNDPPTVVSTKPVSKSVIDPSKEKVSTIIAVLEDGARGSGVDLTASELVLFDPFGNRVPAKQSPYGTNSLKLSLETESGYLTTTGDYTIQVTPVDKRGNKGSALQYAFTVKDTSAPFVVTIQPEPNDKEHPYTESPDEIIAILSDGQTGSGVDFTESELFLNDPDGNVVSGKLTSDEQDKKLMYVLETPLTVSGDYSLVVSAKDKSGVEGVYAFQFFFNLKANINVQYENRTYAIFYIGTQVAERPEFDLNEILVQPAPNPPTLPPNLRQIEAVRFFSNDATLSLPVELTKEADIVLAYQESDIPSSTTEKDLQIYSYNPKSRRWRRISNVFINSDAKTVTTKVKPLDEYYALAIPLSQQPVGENVILSATHFNPNRGEKVIFYFPQGATDRKVEIYNVASELVYTLDESDMPASEFSWDGKNGRGDLVRNGVFICRIRYTVNNRLQLAHKLVAVIK